VTGVIAGVPGSVYEGSVARVGPAHRANLGTDHVAVRVALLGDVTVGVAADRGDRHEPLVATALRQLVRAARVSVAGLR
jgi:hypothetical protein